ncbi:MAG: DsrE/DsrF/DrsH-like family protein [Ardenticatenaceae bacterium]|nr:DsrE/DsrF/DrsH-like family protein [Ardenticatenaceae bacterium]HBY93980.1 peroxiredoxin family protein [Chloroflexota bacterium]
MADESMQGHNGTSLSPELLAQIREEIRQQVRAERERAERPRRLAMVASKGSLDMAYPPLILASAAVSLGWEVAVFCTFYGLDIVNKHKLPHLKVAPVGNPAMPAPLSQIPMQVPNIVGMLPGMTGLATKFMQSWMDRAHLPALQEMIDITMEMDGHFYACSTTMGVMGVSQDDLIEGVEVLGAAAFLDYAADADVVLFI